MNEGKDMRDEKGAEKITVLRRYGSPIDANLAKTKLDAHGIPCFLTEENFTTLYGSNSLIGGGVRLHVFENDLQRAAEILESDFQ